MTAEQIRRRIRWLLLLFIVGLGLSGLTAFPLVWESGLLVRWIGPRTALSRYWPAMAGWIALTHRGLVEADAHAPFLLYGTDWLGFGHLMIALAFWGPLKEPVRNLWVIEFGMLACALVIPTALLMGAIRHIPFFWQMIDCSFGVFGILPLWAARKLICRLSQMEGV